MRMLLIAGLLVAGTYAANAQQYGQQPGQQGGQQGGQRSGNAAAGSKTGATKGTNAGATTPAQTKTVTPPVVQPQVRTPVVIQAPPPPPVFQSGHHRWERRHHDVCHEKSHRLWQYERHAAADGYISYSERQTIRGLRRDLDRTCGGHRWRG